MRQIIFIIFLVCVFPINGFLIAQETTDSLQVQAYDSSALDLAEIDLPARYDYFSDLFRILYAILFFSIAFIFSIYFRQPLQRLSENRRKYSHIIY